MPKRDSKGHFISKRQIRNGWNVCGHCLKNDWKNYYVNLTEKPIPSRG